MSGNLQRGATPGFDRKKVFAEVEASNQRFDGYSKERRRAFSDKARDLAGLKRHEKVRCA